MTLDLPVIETRYSSLHPTYDVAQFLTSGLAPFSEGSVIVTVEANHVQWDCRVRTEDAEQVEGRRILDGLPLELVPPVTVIRPGMQAGNLETISFHQLGWIFMSRSDANLTAGVISFEARTLRRAP